MRHRLLPARSLRATRSTIAMTRRVDLLEGLAPTTHRALRADRAAAASGPDRPRVAVVRQRVEVASGRLPEQRDEERLVERGDLTDRAQAAVVELPGRHAPDTPQPLDGQRMEEAELVVGRHDEQAVRLRHRARHLREELRPRDADRDREADLVEDPLPQASGDLRRRAGEPFETANVEERLVDGEPLDERRRVLEEREDGLARLGVGRHPRRHDDRLRAEAARLAAAHRRLDAVRLRLVAGREHDSAAHDHGSPAQVRIVALLDRGEERIEVGMENGREQANICSHTAVVQHARCSGAARVHRPAGSP